MISTGKKVPDIALPATGDKSVSLKDFEGSHLVLYFYPKDSTPGCTLESQDFRDLHAKIRKAGAHVLGVSRDSVTSHDKVKAAQKLPFDLLSDAGEKLCRAFDVIQEKNMYGRKVLGIERSTFLIDNTGVLRAEWRGIKVAGHVDEVLKAVKLLKKAA